MQIRVFSVLSGARDPARKVPFCVRHNFQKRRIPLRTSRKIVWNGLLNHSIRSPETFPLKPGSSLSESRGGSGGPFWSVQNLKTRIAPLGPYRKVMKNEYKVDLVRRPYEGVPGQQSCGHEFRGFRSDGFRIRPSGFANFCPVREWHVGIISG